MENNIPKMSLGAQFDDLCRLSAVLRDGSEEAFLTFVRNQLMLCCKWKEVRSENEELRRKVSNLESKTNKLETQIKLLKHCVQEEASRYRRSEAERSGLERQMHLVKEVLLSDVVMDNQTKEKLGLLDSGKPSVVFPSRLEAIQESLASVLSVSDADGTGDDLDGTRGYAKGRRSSSESRIGPKKKKLEIVNEFEENGTPTPRKSPTVRCNSEPAGTSPANSINSHPQSTLDSTQFKNLLRCNTVTGSTPGRYTTGGKMSRKHTFVIKIIFHPEKCNVCRESLSFFSQAFKCEDCAIICHPDCKDKCSLPCVSLIRTPTENATGTIADYTSSTAPMIPPLIVHCVNEIESRGMEERGLYRVSGTEREIRFLKNKFMKGRTVPILLKDNIYAICGVIKDFLRSLSEPLITHDAWQGFAKAARLTDNTESLKVMYEIVATLPQPNRDTLAFLILHLQRVAASPKCQMPISSLAKMLGPAIIGYSVPDPAELNVLTETNDQSKVMEKLLAITSDLWQKLLDIECDVFAVKTMKTPEDIPAPRGTILGPMVSSGRKSRRGSSNTTPVSRMKRK